MLLALGFLSCAGPKTHTVYLQYQDVNKEQISSPLTVGLLPFQDLRPSPQSLGERSRSDGQVEPIHLGTPYPSEELTLILRRSLKDRNIQVVDLQNWIPDPNGLRDLPEPVQAAILGRIDDLSVRANSSVLKTQVSYRVVLTAHIGLKERGEVITRTIEVSPKKTLLAFRSQDIERDLNEALTEALNRLFEGILYEAPQGQ
jgi:hypothetical protein